MARTHAYLSAQTPTEALTEAALHNELRLLGAGIRRTEQKLQEFETRYGLPTAEFIRVQSPLSSWQNIRGKSPLSVRFLALPT